MRGPHPETGADLWGADLWAVAVKVQSHRDCPTRPDGAAGTGAPASSPGGGFQTGIAARQSGETAHRHSPSRDAGTGTPIREGASVSFMAGGVCRRIRSWMFLPVGPGIAARQRSEPHDCSLPVWLSTSRWRASAWSRGIAIGCKRGFLIGIPRRKSFCDNLAFLSMQIAFQRQSDNLIEIPRRKSFCDNLAFLSRENVLQRPSHHLIETPSRSPFSHGTRNRVAIP